MENRIQDKKEAEEKTEKEADMMEFQCVPMCFLAVQRDGQMV